MNQIDEVTPCNDDNPIGVIVQKFADAMIPGFQAEFKPDEADQAGAFSEDALTEADALESSIDLLGPIPDGPVFLDGDEFSDIRPMYVDRRPKEGH